MDAVASRILEFVDDQQRATTLSLLLAAIHSVLHEHRAGLDEDGQHELFSLGRRLVTKTGALRPTPQTQNHNLTTT